MGLLILGVLRMFWWAILLALFWDFMPHRRDDTSYRDDWDEYD